MINIQLHHVFHQPDSDRIEKYNNMLQDMLAIDRNAEMYLKWWQFKKKRKILKEHQNILFNLQTIYFSLWIKPFGTNDKGRTIWYKNTEQQYQASVRSGKQ